MNDYICLVQEGDDEDARWDFHCQADDADHAQEQALDHSPVIRVIAVFERVR